MINKIMDAIAIKLHEAFSEEYEIHKNDIKQGLQEPCFLITLIDSTKENLLNLRSKRLLPFDILFFPDKGKSQCYEVSDTLMNELHMIKYVDGDMFHGTNMRSEIVDDVLHFIVSYNYITMVEEENIDSIETWAINSSTTKE